MLQLPLFPQLEYASNSIACIVLFMAIKLPYLILSYLILSYLIFSFMVCCRNAVISRYTLYLQLGEVLQDSLHRRQPIKPAVLCVEGSVWLGLYGDEGEDWRAAFQGILHGASGTMT